MVVLRVATKHFNLWGRQLEMERLDMSNLAWLLKLDVVQKEIQHEKWVRRASGNFTKNVKMMLLEEIDNMVWSGNQKEISQWCKDNKVPDEIVD